MLNVLIYNLFLLIVLYFLFSILSHIIYSVATYKLLKYNQIKYYYLSFLPILNTYLVSSISDKIITKQTNKKSYIRIIVLSLHLMYIILIPTVIYVILYTVSQSILDNSIVMLQSHILYIIILFITISILCHLFIIISLHFIYKKYSPHQAITFTILSIFIWVIAPFLFFSVVNIKTNLK